jgi:hypothetical protein
MEFLTKDAIKKILGQGHPISPFSPQIVKYPMRFSKGKNLPKMNSRVLSRVGRGHLRARKMYVIVR